MIVFFGGGGEKVNQALSGLTNLVPSVHCCVIKLSVCV